MNKSKSVIAELIANRTSLLELILVAILLALSVNLISSSIPEIFSLSPLWVFSIGIFLGLIVLLYSIFRLLKNKYRTQTFEGFFTYSKKRNAVISIPRYEYSEQLYSYLQASFSENEAFKASWKKEPLSERYNKRQEKKNIEANRLWSMDLITEATEYFVLNRLSLHLSDYFNSKRGTSDKTIKQFYRNDIPDVLLSNRFLELFSRPMKERVSFVKHPTENSENIVYARGENGAIFHKFNLILPSESKLSRRSKNQLEIETSRFTLKITVDFSGFNTFVPFEFHRYILNEKEIMDIDDFQVNITMDIEFKSLAFLTSTGWDYYYWVDSFLEDFRESFDETSFFEHIGWNQVLTLMNFLSSKTRKTSVPKKKNTGVKKSKIQ